MKPEIAIAISGGIDSLMAAYLLKAQGHRVYGVHFITGYEKEKTSLETFPETIYPKTSLNHPFPVSAISDQLDIAIDVIDLRVPFKEKVVDYFIAAYLKGTTPNPCLVCNPLIKFGVILDHAKKKGAHRIATGHYARVSTDSKGVCHLKKGVDPVKDQSYFLSFLDQEMLRHAIFPLGAFSKNEVKKLAQELKLTPVTQKESQDICFIPSSRYHEFIEAQPEFNRKAGLIKNIQGKTIGAHQGLHLFTVGQRRGINCPSSEPYYVAGMDIDTHTLVVGFKGEFQTASCQVTHINWIQEPPDTPIEIMAKLRYSQKEIKAFLKPIDRNSATLHFNEPVFPVTPGQGAVFIRDDEILGGGVIAKNHPPVLENSGLAFH